MRRLITLTPFCLLVLVLFLSPANAGQERLAGSWKILFLDGDEVVNIGLLKLEAKDGKLAGAFDGTPNLLPGAAKVEVKKAVLQGEMLSFTLSVGTEDFQFAFGVPKGENKRLLGTFSIGDEILAAQMESTKDDSAKDFKPVVKVKVPKGEFKDFKESVGGRAEDDLGVFFVARLMLANASENKVPTNELKAALAPVALAARKYGVWQREYLLQTARTLAGETDYAGLGEEYSRLALKEAGAANSSLQLRCFDLIAVSLLKQGKKEELTKVRAHIDGLEVKGHEENEKAGLGFDPAKFEGRKGNRVVLVELFTGAHCPPCVAADLAFEGLAKTYATSEVVLLQYHLHIPAPDPLTTPDTNARAKYYGQAISGTPSTFFNGKAAAGGGGFRPHALGKYKEYRQIIDRSLEADNKITLSVAAKRKGDSVTITANAAGYQPGEKLTLRLALVEPWVRYAGSNGLSYHAHVVRALPGGLGGFALTKETTSQTATVDLAEVRNSASKELDRYKMLDGQRPFSYRNLRVVAFIQDDDTKEVLHAVEVAM